MGKPLIFQDQTIPYGSNCEKDTKRNLLSFSEMCSPPHHRLSWLLWESAGFPTKQGHSERLWCGNLIEGDTLSVLERNACGHKYSLGLRNNAPSKTAEDMS